MQRISVRLPDATIARLEAMLAELPVPAIGPAPTIADVLRVVVERGLATMSEPEITEADYREMAQIAPAQRGVVTGIRTATEAKS